MIYIPIVGIAIVIILYFLLRTGLSYLAATRHSLGEELTYAGVTLGSLILAGVGARLLGKVLVELAWDRLVEPQLDSQVRAWLALTPTGTAGLRTLVSLLLVPLLFLIIFIVIHTVSALIAHIPWLVVRKKKEAADDSVPQRRWGLAAIGAGNGFVITLAVLIPVCCLMTLVSGAAVRFFDTGAYETADVQKAVEDGLDTDPAQLQSYIEELDSDFVIGLFGRGPGRAVFRLSTTSEVKTEDSSFRMNLENELDTLVVSAGYGLRTVKYAEGKPKSLSDEGKQLILDLEESVLSSDWLAQTGAEVISGIAGKWADGQSFDSLKAPKINDIMKPLFNRAIGLLSRETKDDLRDDVDTITTILYDLADSRLLVANIDYTVIMERLGKDGLMNQILDHLEANRHLAPLVDELRALSVRVVSSVLNVDKLIDGTYDDLIGEIATRIDDVMNLTREEREAEVRHAVQEAFVNYGYEVPDDLAVELAEQVINELGADGSITPDEVKQYLVDHGAEISRMN